MQIHLNLQSLEISQCVVTLGMFDGLHRGHVSLLKELKQKADELGMPSLVLTFWPHPKTVLQPFDTTLRLLNSLEEKIQLFNDTNLVDHLLIIEFTKEFSKITPSAFVSKFLLGKLHAKYLLMGYNHHFGSGRHSLREYVDMSERLGLPASRGAKFVDENNHKCSSSEVRKAIEAGKIEFANKLLGYNYSLTGKVVSGAGVGSTLGTPTANLSVTEKMKLIPTDGVYACVVHLKGRSYRAAVNIGFRPTLSGKDRQIEVHILDFVGDIYGEDIKVIFYKKIRDEIKFENIEELKLHIREDIKQVEHIIL